MVYEIGMESQTIGIVVVIISLVVLLLASNEKKKSKGKENASIKKESTESSMTASISSELEDRSGRENPKQAENSPSNIEQKLDELNANLVFFKRFIVLITISLFVLMSWTALSATGSWWKWFGFLF